MQFTEEEKTKLNDNVRQIIKFIETDIIPLLNEGENITYDWGGSYRGMFSYESTEMYHLRIEQKTEYMNDYGETHSTKWDGYDKPCNVFAGEKYAYPRYPLIRESFELKYQLCSNWNSIKRVLLGKVADRKAKTSEIMEFKI